MTKKILVIFHQTNFFINKGISMSDGGKLYLESSIDAETRNQLIEKGHNVATDTHVYGGYQAIMWDDTKEVYYGASDPRKDGQAAGY